MRLKVPIILATLAAAMMLAAGTAWAQGNSGADQYRENVPGAGNEQPTEQVGDGSAGSGNGSQAIGGGTREALSEAGGFDGERLADLTDATAPQKTERAKAGGKKKAGKERGKRAGEREPKLDETDPAAGVATDQQAARTSVGTGPSGLGGALPVLMIAALVAALGYRLISARRGRGTV